MKTFIYTFNGQPVHFYVNEEMGYGIKAEDLFDLLSISKTSRKNALRSLCFFDKNKYEQLTIINARGIQNLLKNYKSSKSSLVDTLVSWIEQRQIDLLKELNREIEINKEKLDSSEQAYQQLKEKYLQQINWAFGQLAESVNTSANTFSSAITQPTTAPTNLDKLIQNLITEKHWYQIQIENYIKQQNVLNQRLIDALLPASNENNGHNTHSPNSHLLDFDFTNNI